MEYRIFLEFLVKNKIGIKHDQGKEQLSFIGNTKLVNQSVIEAAKVHRSKVLSASKKYKCSEPFFLLLTDVFYSSESEGCQPLGLDLAIFPGNSPDLVLDPNESLFENQKNIMPPDGPKE